MKKVIFCILILSIFLGGCALKLPKSDDSSKDTAAGSAQTKSGTDTKSGGEDKSTNEVQKSNDASVEALVRLSEDFLEAAYADDPKDMGTYCDDAFKAKIEASPKTYIRTKPDYIIDKITTTITPSEGSKYLLNASVSALKKNDTSKNKNTFKYTFTIQKENDSYRIIDFK